MGNIESNNSHEQNFSEVQKIQDVLSMNTETFVSQRGGLSIGDRVVEQDSGIHGTIIEIHNRYSFINAIMRGDDGKRYEHHISHYISEAVFNASRPPRALPASPIVSPRAASPAVPRVPSPVSTAASHVFRLRGAPAAPAAPAAPFDAFGYCNALMSAPDMPDMSGDDITRGLCAALMKK